MKKKIGYVRGSIATEQRIDAINMARENNGPQTAVLSA
jgi:hypothetical protein